MNVTSTTRALAVALLLLALAGAAQADSPAPVLHGAITGGGGALGAGGYTLVGAMGQPIAGTLQSGGYSLASGVVPLTTAQPASIARVYLPLLRRPN